MFDIVWYYAWRIYLCLVPVFVVIIYMKTDFSKIKATLMVKSETVVVLALLWPLILMYMIKQITWRNRKNESEKSGSRSCVHV